MTKIKTYLMSTARKNKLSNAPKKDLDNSEVLEIIKEINSISDRAEKSRGAPSDGQTSYYKF